MLVSVTLVKAWQKNQPQTHFILHVQVYIAYSNIAVL